MKKIIRLTESDLMKIVKKVIQEQTIEKKYTFKLKDAESFYKGVQDATYKVHIEGGNNVKGKPVVIKRGQKFAITPNMTISPDDVLEFGPNDEINMRSISEMDKAKRSKQFVTLFINKKGKPELFVATN